MQREYIMIHHSLTKDGQVVDWNAITKYHTEVYGWPDIGYHYGIELVNDIYQVMLGRSLDLPGAHCKHSRMNFRALGVCVIGNYDNNMPEAGVLKFLAASVVVPLMRKFKIPSKNIVGHRDYNPQKTCPGEMFPLDILRILCEGML